MATMDALLEASDRELAMSSSHACAQGKDGIADATPGGRMACGTGTVH
jgi:hypothetical protein